MKNIFIILNKYLIGLILLSLFAFEGLGLNHGREITYLLIVILPLYLYLSNLILGRSIKVPVKLTVIFLSLLVSTTISFFIAIDIKRAFEWMIQLLSLYLVFIYVFNNQSKWQELIIILIYAFSIIFSVGTLILMLQPDKYLFLPYLKLGLNFINFTFSNHNHLGDWLVLPLSINIYRLFNRKFNFFYLITSLLFFPLFIFSFSRSSYISLLIALIFIASYFKFIKTTRSIILTVTISVLLISSLLITSNTIRRLKSNLINRFDYISQAYSSIKNNPIFGIGPKNFVIASHKYASTPRQIADTSHNLFIDMFVENGIFGGVLFMIFIFYLFKNSKKDIFFVLLVAMLVNFQTDYTFNIYSFLFLFFIIAGCIYRETKTYGFNTAVLFSLLPYIAYQSYIIINYFIK